MINETTDRVREVPELKYVGEMADFQFAVEQTPKAVPAAYIVELGENPRPAELANMVEQQIGALVGVVFVVRNVGDVSGAAAKDQLRQYRQLVKEKLFGWQPTPEHDPYERGAGHVLAFRDGHVWWLDQYSTSYLDRSVL